MDVPQYGQNEILCFERPNDMKECAIVSPRLPPHFGHRIPKFINKTATMNETNPMKNRGVEPSSLWMEPRRIINAKEQAIATRPQRRRFFKCSRMVTNDA